MSDAWAWFAFIILVVGNGSAIAVLELQRYQRRKKMRVVPRGALGVSNVELVPLDALTVGPPPLPPTAERASPRARVRVRIRRRFALAKAPGRTFRSWERVVAKREEKVLRRVEKMLVRSRRLSLRMARRPSNRVRRAFYRWAVDWREREGPRARATMADLAYIRPRVREEEIADLVDRFHRWWEEDKDALRRRSVDVWRILEPNATPKDVVRVMEERRVRLEDLPVHPDKEGDT